MDASTSRMDASITEHAPEGHIHFPRGVALTPPLTPPCVRVFLRRPACPSPRGGAPWRAVPHHSTAIQQGQQSTPGRRDRCSNRIPHLPHRTFPKPSQRAAPRQRRSSASWRSTHMQTTCCVAALMPATARPSTTRALVLPHWLHRAALMHRTAPGQRRASPVPPHSQAPHSGTPSAHHQPTHASRRAWTPWASTRPTATSNTTPSSS